MNHRARLVSVAVVAVLGAPPPSVAQSGCSAQLSTVQGDLRQFDSQVQNLGLGGRFLSAGGLDRKISAQSPDLSAEFLAWNGRVSNWRDAVRAYSSCLGAPPCDVGQVVSQTSATDPDIGQWLSSLSNGLGDATQKSADALGLLDGYLAGAGAPLAGSVARAMSCLASQPAGQRTSQPASPAKQPPGLPPQPVKQDLSWPGPTFQESKLCVPGKPFKFSLCEDKFIELSQESKACYPKLAKNISGGRQLQYLFSQGHGRVLPKGIGVDGFGTLFGNDCGDLLKADQLPLCVKQLNSESCGDFAPKAQATRAAQKGGGGGAKLLGGLVLAGGAVAAGIYAGKAVSDAAATSSGSGSGGSGSGGGMTYVGVTGPTCFFNSGGVLSRCSGSIAVSITSKIASGSRLKLLTQGAIQSDIVQSVASPPGVVNFPISGGTGGLSCPGPITQLNLLNTSVSTSNVVAQVGGLSLRVTCQ